MPREAALKLAKEKGFDLIEIAPTAKPAVAKIINYDKFRYQKEREFKKQRAGQKISELKQVQISVRAAQNDSKIKAEKVDEFLGKNYKVEIILRLRGREKYNKDWARYKLEEFLKMITVEYKIVLEPRFIGQGLVMQIMGKRIMN